MVRPFRLSVGRVRTTSAIGSTEAANIRSVRTQMRTIEKNFQKFVQHMGNVLPEVLVEALQPTFEKSQRYVPEDTSRLKKSGYLEVRQRAEGAVAEMGYGRGGNPPYTVFVHERMELKHKSPTRAKFLQAAIQEDSSAIAQRIQDLTAKAGGV